MINRLMGYDARTVSATARFHWADQDRRKPYLLRSDVTFPLSVDCMVWPSVFDWGEGLGLPDAERRRWLLQGLPTPEDRIQNIPWNLWAESTEMRAALKTLPPQEYQPYWLMAVSWADGNELIWAFAQMNSWKFLGYDVADESLLSGLTNCGYQGDERLPLRASWAPYLNDFHLFAEYGVADHFRRLTDDRVVEHQPFQVYAVWRIPDGRYPPTYSEGFCGLRLARCSSIL